MKLAVDTSALAKRYVREVGSERIAAYLQRATQLGLCIILLPELVSGLNRRLRERSLPKENYQKIKRQLLDDMRDATVLQLTPAVISRSLKLLETNTLRAMDALHVACALEWGAGLFLTADRKQSNAAQRSGLPTEYLGD